MEMLFQFWLQCLLNQSLDDAVGQGRYPQLPDTPIRLGYFNPLNWRALAAYHSTQFITHESSASAPPLAKLVSLAKSCRRVLTPSSASPLRARKPPCIAIRRITSRRVSVLWGGGFSASSQAGCRVAWAQSEFDFVQRGRGRRRWPQFAALGQAPVVLGTQHIVRRIGQRMGALHQFKHVGLAVSDIDQARARQFLRTLGHPFIPFNPAPALQRAQRSCPHPVVQNTQRQPLERHRIGRMHIHAALCFIGQLPKPSMSWPLKSSSVVSCRHSTTGCAAIRASVRAMCGARTDSQPNPRLSARA